MASEEFTTEAEYMKRTTDIALTALAIGLAPLFLLLFKVDWFLVLFITAPVFIISVSIASVRILIRNQRMRRDHGIPSWFR